MDFKSAKELLALCRREDLPISEVMRRREVELGETTREAVDRRMARALEIMGESAALPLKEPARSTGGLIGGESRKLYDHAVRGEAICGPVLQRALAYAMGVSEGKRLHGPHRGRPHRRLRRGGARAAAGPPGLL